MKPTCHILANQKGVYFLMSAIVLSVMVGFAALGVEIGRWYSIQAEMSKAIDGAAFAGAKNVNNPLFPNDAAFQAFVVQVAQANFPSGLLGTDAPVFTAAVSAQGLVSVNGTVNSLNNLTTTFDAGTPTTALSSVGSAQLRRAEVALVLDVSGSMDNPDPQPIVDLRDGATLFVNNFQSFQKDHRFALITFATGVQTPFPMDTDFVFNMTNQIAALDANGGTNTEDALGQTVNLPWTPGQLGVPMNQRIQQVVIMFSDGNPSGFRAGFRYNGADIDAVALLHGTGDNNVWQSLGRPDVQVNYFTNFADTLGPGNLYGSSACDTPTTRWYIFDDPTYGLSSYGQGPMASYSPPACIIGVEPPGLVAYTQWLVRQMAIDHAAQLKAQGIVVYTIGLGAVDQSFLQTIATDLDHAKFANSSSELSGIFQEIANDLKLILVS